MNNFKVFVVLLCSESYRCECVHDVYIFLWVTILNNSCFFRNEEFLFKLFSHFLFYIL